MTVLHVGCGGAPLPPWLASHVETRLDISPECKPDIVASMADLGDIGPFDVVFSSHSLEHLWPHDAQKSLNEAHRVLKPGGYVAIFVPDLEGVEPTNEVIAYGSAGGVTGRDLIYGMASLIEQSEWMAHKTGFTAETMREAMQEAGFSRIETKRLENYQLFAVGIK